MPSPLVSVVIATRNRAESLARLLRSVAEQDLPGFEVIVVDDESTAETLACYGEIRRSLDSRFRFLLPARPNGPGHGPSQPRNKGIAAAAGRYVALCDDDDAWIVRDHLSTAAGALEERAGDFYFAGMRMVDGGKVTGTWYAPAVPAAGARALPGRPNVYELSLPAFARMLTPRCPCVNTMVFRRELFLAVGGYWENIRYYEDVDLVTRFVDRSQRILYRAEEVAETDVAPHVRAFTAVDELERNLFTVTACQHARAHVGNRLLRRNLRSREAWALLGVARQAAARGDGALARSFLAQSLLAHFSRAAALAWLRSWRAR